MTPGALQGLFIQPNDSDPRWFLIEGNTANGIVVAGELQDYLLDLDVGSTYRVFDLRLRSDSPAIDSGNGCTDSATCDPLIPLTDIDGNARYDASQTNVYECNAIPEPQCYEYVDVGAYEYVP
jgi:hypothetical protein